MPGRRVPDGLLIEISPRWVRMYFGGTKVADTRRALLVLEPSRPATYWIPLEDVRRDHLTADNRSVGSPTQLWTLRVGDRVAKQVAWSYPHPEHEWAALRDHIAFDAERMDAWYEEDDEVFAHPLSPYHRVDVRRSSRRVTVVIGDQTVADTARPSLLFETGLPTCYYLPQQDVRMDLLVPSDMSTTCPYKGVARYWSVRVGDVLIKEVAWSYPAPIAECRKIENLVSFYNGKVDILVDDEPKAWRP